MTIEVTGPDGSIAEFPEGTPADVMQAALAKVYGGPQTAGAALNQLSDPGTPPASSQDPSDPLARASLALAALPSGGGYGPIADAIKDAASPWLNALTSDPSPVWSQRLGLLGHATALREAAGSMAGSMLDAGVSPAMAGLSLDPDSGDWTLPRSLTLSGSGPAPTAATWLGLYHTLPSLMETDPWTGQPLADQDSPRNADIAKIAGELSSAFTGDPLTGAGGAIPGFGDVQGVFGDPFTIRAAHDGMDGALFSSDPKAFTAAWAKASTPAEQAAARSAVTSEINDRIQSGQVMPGQLSTPDAQSRLATAFGLSGARNIAAQAESLIASRYGPSVDADQASQAPAVTAPPNASVAAGTQPYVPTTPIAASLVQDFDPGGIAGSLVPAGVAPSNPPGVSGASVYRSANPLPPTPPNSPASVSVAGQAGAPTPNDAGYGDIVITGRRRGPWDYLRRAFGDLGAVNFPAAGYDFGRFADTSGVSAPFRGIAAFVRNGIGDIDWRHRAAASAIGEARYDLSHRSVTNTPLQNLGLDAQATIAGGKSVVLNTVARPLGLWDATTGAFLRTTLGGQNSSGLVGDDYYTNELLKIAPAFAGVPEAPLAETAAPDSEASFEQNSLRAAAEAPLTETAEPDVDGYVSGLRTKLTPTSRPANLFEIEQTGPFNYQVVGRQAKIDIDGYAGKVIKEAKFVRNARNSPYVEGSRASDLARTKVFERQSDEFRRLSLIIRDPEIPFNSLDVLTNHPDAVPYFEKLMNIHQIPGSVKIVTTKIPFK